MDLSIIYPVHITFATRYILKRLKYSLNNTTKGLPKAEHLIALSGSSKYTKQAKQLLNTLDQSIRIIDYPTPTTPYSPGTARNYAVKHTTKNHLLFWDIDLLGSPQLYKRIASHIKNIQHHTNAFEMYPCLYLCNEYTKQFKGKTKQDFNQVWTDTTSLKTNSIEHFAMATSTILCNKQHFLDTGAFDEGFIGHMGEDLDLLNRLSISYGKFPFEANHCEDVPSKVAAELKGFRKHFIHYSVPHLNQKIFTAHLYHSTHIGSAYKNKNKKNLNRLLRKIKSKSYNPIKGTYDIQLESYLRYKPIINLKQPELMLRKIRKLLINPTQFFKDIKR